MQNVEIAHEMAFGADSSARSCSMHYSLPSFTFEFETLMHFTGCASPACIMHSTSIILPGAKECDVFIARFFRNPKEVMWKYIRWDFVKSTAVFQERIYYFVCMCKCVYQVHVQMSKAKAIYEIVHKTCVTLKKRF